MTSWVRNHLAKLYSAVLAPVAATRDAIETTSLLYNRMVENMGYGQEKLKDIVEKEAEEEQQQKKKMSI